MHQPDDVKEWLIKGMNQQAIYDNPYQYGYKFMIHDRMVIVTANGHTAHYSWVIPDVSNMVVHEQAGVQVVDFGFGHALDAAIGWKTADSAFSNLLDRFAACASIRVNTSRFIDAVADMHLSCKHGFDSGAAIQLTYRPYRLQLSCLQENSDYFELPVESLDNTGAFKVTVQSGYLKNALLGFENARSITCRFVLNPDILAIGNEGDLVAIIMGIQLDEKEE